MGNEARKIATSYHAFDEQMQLSNFDFFLLLTHSDIFRYRVCFGFVFVCAQRWGIRDERNKIVLLGTSAVDLNGNRGNVCYIKTHQTEFVQQCRNDIVK